MPRKKVAPDDRVRVVRACRPCKQRKKKCNGSNPCTNCVKRGIANECDLEENTSAPPAPVSDRVNSTTTKSTSEPIVPSSVGGPSPNGTSSSVLVSGDSGSPEVSVRTNPRMLSNARGERLFIGEHASLSFLQLMRDIVHTSIGASAFTSEPRRNFMLEAELNETGELDEGFFSDGRIEACVDAYLLATNGLIDLFDREEIMSILQTVTGSDSTYDSSLTAITYLVLAIGAQVVTDENYARKEHVLFALGRKAAFENCLEDPGIVTAQLFVLCAFYMFGACRRNAAYMYLGVASRAAHCIGLHNHKTYETLSSSEVKQRSRLWKSLFSLDIIACSILGRPPASTSSKITYLADLSDTQATWASSSIYKLARVVEDISASLSGRKTLQVEEAERQVEAIQTWRRELPDTAQIDTSLGNHELKIHRKTIGSLHISCFHQFAVLLVTRPFLVPVLMKRIAIQQQSPLASTDFMSDIDEARASRLAHTCVNVAILMAQTCWNVYDRGLILGNMCILKAWIFSAALVIGFHLFAITEPDAEAMNAFSQSQIILQHLSMRSPQAKHYYDILSYLSDAIEKRQQQRATPSRKQNAFSIDEIMTLNTESSSLRGHDILSEVAFDPTLLNTANSGMDAGAWLNNMPANDGQMQQFLESADFGWNAAMMPFWNHFSFDV